MTEMPSPMRNTIEENSDEIEIDLGKYVRRVWQGRRAIVSLALVGALLGAALSFIAPAEYESTSSVAIVKSRTDIQFDPRVKTLSADELAALGGAQVNAEARRNALLSLVTSGDVATQVLAQLGDKLLVEERNPAKLLRNVKAELAQKGDLILIRVRNKNATLAAETANLWAMAYEKYANKLYVSSLPNYATSVDEELKQSQTSYETTQKALEEFLANNKIGMLSRQISDTQSIIQSLSKQRTEALVTAIEKRLSTRTDIISEYLEAQKTLGLSTISESVQAQINLLSNNYASKVQLEKLLQEASSLRMQAQAGGGSSVRTNGLAIVLLKARAFNSDGIASNTQLQLSNVSDTAQTAEEQLTDLDALIRALESQQKTINTEIEKLSNALVQGQGIVILTSTADSPLQQAAAEQYADLLGLKNISDIVPASATSTDSALTKLIDQYQITLDQANSGLETENARGKNLQQARDVNWEAYTVIVKKQAEVRIAATLAGSEVRFAASAVEPDQRVSSRLVPVAGGAVLGLLLGLIAALIANASDSNSLTQNKTARWLLAGQ